MLTFLFLGAMFALLLASTGRVSQERSLRAAEHRRRLLADASVAEHEYAVVDARSFAHLDLGYYDRAAAALEELGFRKVADIEDLTLSRIYPGLRTFVRAMVDDGGIIRAEIQQVRRRGMVITLGHGFVSGDVLIELVTEVPQGHFLSTGARHGFEAAPPPPEVEVERLPADSGVTDLVTRHRERVAARLGKQHRNPMVVTSYESLIASVQRGNAAAARARSGSAHLRPA